MNAICHRTPGLIDIRAFAVMGLNSKPNAQNPIGYFGTGLKYAVAVLIRQGCSVTVWVGTEPHVFYGEKTTFRDKDFLQLRYRRQRGLTARWMSSELPFTTELGKNWELWMAFRELHSNTLDEGGETRLADNGETGEDGFTKIIVEGDAYREVFDDRGRIFLDPARPRLDDVPEGKRPLVERLQGRSEFAYYRGLRASKLPRPSLYTWNFLALLDLTEDRTLTYPHMVPYYIAGFVMAHTDQDFLRQVMRADEDTLEGGISWDNYRDSHTISPEFLEAARKWGRPKHTVQIVRAADEREQRLKSPRPEDWRAEVLKALEAENEATWVPVIKRHKARLSGLLQASLDAEASLAVAPPPEVPDMPF